MPRVFRSDKIGQRLVRFALLFRHLLSEKMERRQNTRSRFIAVDFHIITDGVRRKNSVNSARGEKLPLNDLLEQFLRIDEKLARLFTVSFVVENCRIASAQFPGVKKR